MARATVPVKSGLNLSGFRLVDGQIPEPLRQRLRLADVDAVKSVWDRAFAEVAAVSPDRPRVYWAPLPGPQTEAFNSDADIIGYGGAAGGGKSDFLLGFATQKHTRSVIFRQEAAQLGDIIDRSREIIGDAGRLNEQKGVWRDLPDGAIIGFGGLSSMEDIKKRRGRANDFMGFDEATEIPKEAIETVLAWNRSTRPGQKSRAVLAFNPPTSPEGEWIIEYFGPWLDPEHENPAKPGELRWYAKINGKDTIVPDGRTFVLQNEQIIYDFDPADVDPTDIITPKSRTFFPARVTDNPYLMASGYVSQLQALPEPLRTQMLKGLFDVAREEDPWQFIPALSVAQAQQRFQKTPPDNARLVSLGVDCARGGRDNNYIRRLYEGTRTFANPETGEATTVKVLWYPEPIKIPGVETKTGQELVNEILRYYEPGAAINIDVIGVGSSPYDLLCEHFKNLGLDPALIVFPINNGAGAPKRRVKRQGKMVDAPATDVTGRISFRTYRSFSFWLFKELLEGMDVVDRWAQPPVIEPVQVELYPDRETKADLCVAKWKFDGGQAKIESKDDIKARLPGRRSPDVGDATLLAACNRGEAMPVKRNIHAGGTFISG